MNFYFCAYEAPTEHGNVWNENALALDGFGGMCALYLGGFSMCIMGRYVTRNAQV